MKESALEQKFAKRVKEFGGLSRKWSNPAHRGAMDRIVFWPDGVVHFVELKVEKGKLSRLQEHEKRVLEKMGASVFVLYGWEDCEFYILESAGVSVA